MPKRATRKPLHEAHRRSYEMAVLALMLLGAVAVIAGGAGVTVDVGDWFVYGAWASGVGVALVATATALGLPLDSLRATFRKTIGSTRYEVLRHRTRLKTAGILLNLLAAIAAILLVASLAQRLDPLTIEAPFPVVFRLTTLFTLVLVLAHFAAHYQSLRTPSDRPPPSGPVAVVFYLLSAVAAAFGLLGAAVAASPLDLAGLAILRPSDAPFFLLAGAAFAAIALFVGRGVPTLYVLVAEERGSYGASYLSRSKSVVMPAMMAFGLLFLVILLLLVFGVGVVGLVEEIPRSTLLLGVFGFILVAMVASIAVALMLSRSEDRARLYKVHRSPEARQGILVLGLSTAAAAVLLAVSGALALGYDVGGMRHAQWTDFLAFALLAILGPFGFLMAHRYRRTRRLEERFPDFLRDVAASRKAGLTLTEAVSIASRGEYGALTPEVVKMADQLSWNVPFDEALIRFGERVRTPLVQRAVSLINEASRTGGNVTDVLLAAARDAREIKNLENERRNGMALYTAIIYIVFAVFLAVAAVLYGTFVPQVLATTEATKSAGLPEFAGFSFAGPSLEDYRVFYFLGAVIQGLGNGLIAGMMGSGKPLDGLRHAFIMVMVAYGVFTFLLPAGA